MDRNFNINSGLNYNRIQNKRRLSESLVFLLLNLKQYFGLNSLIVKVSPKQKAFLEEKYK
jgi:hypothetical protein